MSLDLLGKGGFYGWISLTATALVSFFVGGAIFYSFGTFLPSICKEFGWSRGLVSGAYSISMVLMSLSSFLAGFFIGKHGPRKATIIGCTMSASGLLLLAFHSKVWQLYVGYGVLIGLGNGLGWLIAPPTIANNWFRKKVPFTMGIIIAAAGFGGIVLTPVIMAMINHIGWRSTYLVLFVLILVFAVVIPGIFIRNKPEDMGQVPDGVASTEHDKTGTAPKTKQYVTPVDFTVKEAMGTGTLWLLIIIFTMVVFLLTMFMAHQVAFLEDIGITTGIAAVTLGLISGIAALGNLLIGFLALKFNLKKLAIMSLALILLGMILLLLTRSLPMAFTYTIIFGFGYGGSFVAVMSLLSSYFGRKDYPKIVGAMMVFSIIGNAGAPIAGAIYDVTKSYTIAFTIALIAAAIGLLCMILVRPPVHPSLKEKSVPA